MPWQSYPGALCPAAVPGSHLACFGRHTSCRSLRRKIEEPFKRQKQIEVERRKVNWGGRTNSPHLVAAALGKNGTASTVLGVRQVEPSAACDLPAVSPGKPKKLMRDNAA
jgi:hypothetical protein